MRVRLATLHDINRLAEITHTSLRDDPTFDYMWPHWRKYPRDNIKGWQARLRKLLCDKKTVFIVATVDSDDGDADEEEEEERLGVDGLSGAPAAAGSTNVQEVIVSYAVWERLGDSDVAKQRWAMKKRSLLGTALEISTSIHQKIHVRRDKDDSHLQALDDAQEGIRQRHWSEITDLWNLELLVTGRQYRRRGAASALVQYGVDRADQEGVYCRVEASPMGKEVYGSPRFGFKELEEYTVQVDGDDATLVLYAMRRNPKVVVDESRQEQ